MAKPTEKIEDTKIYLLLVLDDSSVIELNYPEDIAVEVMDSMQDAIREKDWMWNCGDWNELDATYHELPLAYINLARVVGIA